MHPELFTYIKIHIDEHHNPGDFLLTGSQIFRLMHGVQESLAGRVAVLHMSPLSQRELISAQPRPFSTCFEALVEDSKNISPLTTPEIFERIWNGVCPDLPAELILTEIFFILRIFQLILKEMSENYRGPLMH